MILILGLYSTGNTDLANSRNGQGKDKQNEQ